MKERGAKDLKIWKSLRVYNHSEVTLEADKIVPIKLRILLL